MRIAIVGTGISGLSCGWLLNQRHRTTLFEAEARPGGHTNTMMMSWQGSLVPVDTGFVVYNERNYPNLTRLFAYFEVPTRPSEMSFGVSIDDGRFEYAGRRRGLFAQWSNLARPRFAGMLLDILRFGRDGSRHLAAGREDDLTLGEFLNLRRYGKTFRSCYLLPMAAAIWSGSIGGMMAFPATSFLRFFANHGLLTFTDRPLWRSVAGGAATYVCRMSEPFVDRIRLATPVRALRRVDDGVEVLDGFGDRQRFDQVVLACHADQALAMIERPTRAEREVLGAFRYQTNRAVLHQDAALMPKRRAVWSSWNHLGRSAAPATDRISLTYWVNRLQDIDPECPAFVSLNPLREPARETISAEFSYRHPQYTLATLAAQTRLTEIQGCDRLWFCGAHWGYGFHEDGLRSGLEVAAALGVSPPWWHAAPVRRRIAKPATAAAG